jgi:hypothetical protein
MTAGAEAIIDRAIVPETSPQARCSEPCVRQRREKSARAPPYPFIAATSSNSLHPRLEPQQRTHKSDSGSPADLYSQAFIVVTRHRLSRRGAVP